MGNKRHRSPSSEWHRSKKSRYSIEQELEQLKYKIRSLERRHERSHSRTRSSSRDIRSDCLYNKRARLDRSSRDSASTSTNRHGTVGTFTPPRAQTPPPRNIECLSDPPSPVLEQTDDGDVLVLNNDEELDDETLKALGEDKPSNLSSFSLHSVLKNRWLTILSEGLPKDEKTELLTKYCCPHNLERLRAPLLNAEIVSVLSSTVVNRDKYQIVTQNNLGSGIAALGQAINLLLEKDPVSDAKPNLLKLLGDAGRIFTDVFHSISVTRRATITPLLNKTVKEISGNTPVESFLFGDNLAEKIKAVKALESTSKVLKPQSTTAFKGSNTKRPITHSRTSSKPSNSLNWRGQQRFKGESKRDGRYPLQRRK